MIPAVIGPLAAAGKETAPLLEKVFERGLPILGLVLGLLVVQQIVFLLVRRVGRFVAKEAGSEHPEVQKRAATVSSVLKSVTNVLLIGLGLVFTLEILGIDVRPFLAGAGIAGVALGFGAQGLVRDIVAGVFILAENQISVGDTVLVAGVTGVVERVKVRSVTLRDAEGRVHYVPCGEIRTVTNLSQGVAKFVLDVPIPADADGALALATLLTAVREFAASPATRGRLLDPPEVLGYERFGAGQNVIRLTLRALRQDQPLVRELRYAVLRALAAHGIRAGAMGRDGTPSTEAAGADAPAHEPGESS